MHRHLMISLVLGLGMWSYYENAYDLALALGIYGLYLSLLGLGEDLGMGNDWGNEPGQGNRQ